MSPDPEAQREDSIHLFVDEAGDPTLFNSSGSVIVSTSGCSRFFILGRLEVDDPAALSGQLEQLRASLLANPYFAGVESFRPERGKTAIALHAKDDLPEVRYQVFDLLRRAGKAVRFQAVVCDKSAVAKAESARREQQPGHRYNPDHLYDGLTSSLFASFQRMADHYHLWVAKRGAKDRTHALTAALEKAEQEFEKKYGFKRPGDWHTTVSLSRKTTCLQAVDYFLWAVQRFYEERVKEKTGERIREDRFLNLVWPQVVQIHDLHHGPTTGTFYGPQKALTLAERFGGDGRKRKRP
jgi:hypothetical protein